MSTMTLEQEVDLVRAVLRGYPQSLARSDAERALNRIDAHLAREFEGVPDEKLTGPSPKGEVPVGRRVRPQPQRSANMAKKKFYVVLNPAKNEGYVTDDKAEALFASENIRPAGGNSLIAEALREAYVEADEEAALPMIEIELEV